MVYISMDDYTDKKLLSAGQTNWLFDHDELLMEWLDDNMLDEDDWRDVYKRVLAKEDEILAFLFYLYLKQLEDYSIQEKFELISNSMIKQRGHISIIIGARRSGKTTFTYQLCEYLKKRYGEKIWWFGVPAKLPDFIDGSTLDFNKIPENTTTIVDEASVQFYSRLFQSEEQVDITRKLSIVSHTGRNFIVITQSASILDINFIRQATSMIFTSKSFLTIKKERLIINPYLDYFMPRMQGQVLYFDDSHLLEIKFNRPDWWKQEYSDPYRAFKNDIEAYRFVLTILKDITDTKTILDYLGMRSYTKLTDVDIEYFKLLLEIHGSEIYGFSNSKLLEIIKRGMDDTPLNDLVKRY